MRTHSRMTIGEPNHDKEAKKTGRRNKGGMIRSCVDVACSENNKRSTRT
jgi:hypothetical protein